MKVKYKKTEPNSVRLEELEPGKVFKVSRGQTPYLILAASDHLLVPNKSTATVSLESGKLHFFSPNHLVVELEGTLELARIRIERNRR